VGLEIVRGRDGAGSRARAGVGGMRDCAAVRSVGAEEYCLVRLAQLHYSACMSEPVDSTGHALLTALGRTVREHRRARGWTLAETSAEAGISVRFLADVEAGRGNISVVRLADLSRAFGCTPSDLLERRGPVRLALLGLRGAGKSSVGALVAARLRVPFVELDQRVEEAVGLPLAEIFAVHGEAYYRRMEREVLRRVLAGDGPFVLAAGGGLVTDATTYDSLQRGCTTVWLRCRPEEHMARVAAQGDLRPMAKRSDAMAELRTLLASRGPLYARADHTVETSGLSSDRVADRVLVLVAT
jgi:XRE family transcriptional regulator, aerobic/anaerobic benzoate catabolism transcriptional regulator